MTKKKIFDYAFAKNIQEKLHKMSIAYQNLNIFENFMREYIRNKGKRMFGDDWETNLTIKVDIRKKIAEGKGLKRRWFKRHAPTLS